MKFSSYKLIAITAISMAMFIIYAYLISCIVIFDNMRLTYQIKPHLINFYAFITIVIIRFPSNIDIYVPFIITTLLIYIQSSLDKSQLKTLCFLLIYPLLSCLSMLVIMYEVTAYIYNLDISVASYVIVQTLIYTAFLILILVVYSKLAKLFSDCSVENDKTSKWQQNILYNLLFVYFIWKITINTLSYNFFINYNDDPDINLITGILSFFYTSFILAYLILWTYPYLSNHNKNNFIILIKAFFIICILWLLVITIFYKTDITYSLMRWFSSGDKYKKNIILFLVFIIFIFLMKMKTDKFPHYVLCTVIFVTIVVTLNIKFRDIFNRLALQLCYITVFTTIFYCIHHIAFRIAFFKNKKLITDSSKF